MPLPHGGSSLFGLRPTFSGVHNVLVSNSSFFTDFGPYVFSSSVLRPELLQRLLRGLFLSVPPQVSCLLRPAFHLLVEPPFLSRASSLFPLDAPPSFLGMPSFLQPVSLWGTLLVVPPQVCSLLRPAFLFLDAPASFGRSTSLSLFPVICRPPSPCGWCSITITAIRNITNTSPASFTRYNSTR